MKLKKLKNYRLKFLIYFIFLISSSSLYANECKKIIFSKSEIYILSKKYGNKSRFLVDLADIQLKREIGLQCKKHLKENEGMLFIWNSEDQRFFWMKNTKFYLDIIFINSKLEIIDIFFNAKPYNLDVITSDKKSKYILELNAGVLKQLDFKIGDKVIFKNIK